MKVHITILSLIMALLISGISCYAQEKYKVSGYVKDSANGEDLIGATVKIENSGKGTATNAYGFYSLSLTEGTHTLVYSYVGYQSVVKEITVDQDITIDVQLNEKAREQEEVVIKGKREDENVKATKMSNVELDMKQVKSLPPLFGEPDIIKTTQMLPGVSSAGEGTSSFFVRGGGADENLILLDEAPVYDPSHLFGLFSVFNTDIIKSSELYKGGIPPQYGGRLSSLLDIRSRDGNKKELTGGAGIGLMASKAYLEGPIKKNKHSFLISGRRSYADLFLPLSPNESVRENKVYFYDINAKAHFDINKNNRLFVSGYYGRDVFKFNDIFKMDWGNITGTLRWNHIFNENLFSNTTLIFSNFDYGLGLSQGIQAFDWTSYLREVRLKEDMSLYLSPRMTLNFGFSSSYRDFQPGSFQPSTDNSIFTGIKLPNLYAFENAVYVGNEHDITEKFSMEYGVRLSSFSHIGKATVYDYKNIRNNQAPERTDSTEYDRFEFIKTFVNPEPRVTARYTLNDVSSVKGSYTRMVQYVHQMITGTTPLPISVWQPSTKHIDPEIADQWAVGYFRNFKNNTYETSAEVYYKDMNQILDFADNAQVFFNEDLPTVLRPGDSWSYGAEFMIKKTKGDLTGWLSYTWSKTERQIPGVNQGRVYPSNQDIRHNASLVASYSLNKKWTFSGNWVFNTGRPITLPAGNYALEHYNVNYFTERNGYRLPNFHRLDLSAVWEPGADKDRKWQGEWHFSVYNVYNRKNPFTIYTETVEDESNNSPGNNYKKVAKMIYLFPVLPSVSYNISF